jgi:hypothetical protein
VASVRLDGLRKSFGSRPAVRGVSIEFQDGEMTSVLGPSGCGKTTMLNLIAAPYVFLTVKAVVSRMDASLEDASLICGAGIGRTLWHVLIPLGLPAMLSAGILVLTRALEEFAIPGVLGAPSGIYTVTTYIYYQAVSYIPPRYEVAALLATALMAITALCLVLQARLLGGGRRFTTVSGKAQPPRLVRLGRWRYVTLAYALAYIALTVVVPYLVPSSPSGDGRRRPRTLPSPMSSRLSTRSYPCGRGLPTACCSRSAARPPRRCSPSSSATSSPRRDRWSPTRSIS